MKLSDAQEGQEYRIVGVDTTDPELNSFLFSLGCYSGEKIRLLSRKKSGCVISVKNSRYNIDINLAKTIIV